MKDKKPKNNKGITKIVGSSPNHEYGWKNDHEKPKEEPEFGTPEHVKQFLEKQDADKKNARILKTTDPGAIQKVLAAKQTAKKDDTVLSFDFLTGDLIVSNERIPSNNNVVVDQIYKDGFFNNPPQLHR